MKKRLSIYSIIMILGCVISLILQGMRITGHVDMTLFQTLVPALIPYIAMAGTLIIAFIYGMVCGVLGIDIDID